MKIELTEREAKVIIYAIRAYKDNILPYTDNLEEYFDICRGIEDMILRKYMEGYNNIFKNHENLKISRE